MVEYWATLALRVTDKNTGSPVEGATVSASGKQAQSGVDGIAVLYDMPTNGPYPAPQYVLSYTVSKAGYYNFSGEARTNVEGDYFAEYPQLIPIPLPPEYSTVTISVAGQGVTDPSVGTFTRDLGSALYVTATPNSGWRYDRMKRNGVDWTQTNPGEFLNLATTELIEVAFAEDVAPPPRTNLLIPAIGIGLLVTVGIIWMATKKDT